MKRYFLFGTVVAIVLLLSCGNSGNTIDSNIKQSFKTWAKVNIDSKYKVSSIVYDTVGTPFDYIYNGYMLNQTVGSSGKSDSEGDIASNLIMLEGILDSTYMTTNIIVAKVNVNLKDSDISYYIGIRGDSICTTPKQYAYEALIATHHEGEQKMYEAIREIETNLNSYVNTNLNIHLSENESEDDFYTFWVNLPRYEETMKSIGNY